VRAVVPSPSAKIDLPQGDYLEGAARRFKTRLSANLPRRVLSTVVIGEYLNLGMV
jgi:hypothetical protein